MNKKIKLNVIQKVTRKPYARFIEIINLKKEQKKTSSSITEEDVEELGYGWGGMYGGFQKIETKKEEMKEEKELLFLNPEEDTFIKPLAYESGVLIHAKVYKFNNGVKREFECYFKEEELNNLLNL